MTTATDFAARLRERIHEGIVETRTEIGTDVVVVDVSALIETLTVLRDEHGFDMLVDVSVVDWLPREPRYDVNYQLLSVADVRRVRVTTQLAGVESPHVPTAVGVWAGANWHEREVYDFFGIVFDGHPNLSRIFMPDEWIGHPLRKDYPVGGVPVEYRIEPAYVGDLNISDEGRPSAGGIPARLRRDRGKQSPWTWTGQPASGVRKQEPVESEVEEPS